MPHATKEARNAYRREYWKSYDKAKAQAAARARHARLRRFVDAVKTTAGCIDCGYDSYAVALDFDHVAGKNVTISVSCKSIQAAVAEMELCVVRCANCHRVKTHYPCKPDIFDATYEPAE